MTNLNQVFAVYSKSRNAELAVEELIGEGFERGAITALFDDNKTSRDFARRNDTRPPAGTDHGEAAGVPLDGTWGFTEPGSGPVQGALEGALAAMGVPDEWGRSKMLDGKVLVSVKCLNPETMLRAKNIFIRAADDTGCSDADFAPVRT